MRTLFTISRTRSTQWITFLFGLVVLIGACRKPDEDLGLELLPSDALGLLEDTATIHAYTFRDSAVRTSGLTRNLVGSYLDQEFGFVRTGIVTQLRLSSNNVGVGVDVSGLQADSIVLSLAFDGINYAYGNLDAQTFEVHEITTALSLDSSYHTDDVPEFLPDDLCYSHGSIVTPEPFNYAQVSGDSLLPQVRIRLSNDLAVRFLQEFGGDNLATNENFQEFFKGLYITVNNGPQLPFQQGLLYFSLINGASKVVLYYKDANVEPDVQRTFELLINSSAARYTVAEHDYSQAVDPGLNNALADSSAPAYKTYVQSLGGLRTALRFPYLMNYAGEGRVLSKAELVAPVEGTYNGLQPPPNQLFLFRKDSLGADAFLPDQLGGIIAIDGSYNATDRVYRFNITRYINDILTGEISNTGIEMVSGSNGVSGNRVILSGPAKEQNGMRLHLTFTTY
ncbi:MAG: DUF4270 domain-containing protein [Flavobacteriales bacterium]|nr:DUF4270 domain-containing protein [Flavobacteriales bacterium]